MLLRFAQGSRYVESMRSTRNSRDAPLEQMECEQQEYLYSRCQSLREKAAAYEQMHEAISRRICGPSVCEEDLRNSLRCDSRNYKSPVNSMETTKRAGVRGLASRRQKTDLKFLDKLKESYRRTLLPSGRRYRDVKA
ncbi:hypothetical protein AMELA_G00001410 [Ameiurus melas]|uniref:Uncharacterized protein n=1 Tax=Ameiurus melas TaxID=219545 RepID=A0A7J6BFL3_AMEME|nr:hypothetical protein AMELA_G00001410 [Ameiurus melas]